MSSRVGSSRPRPSTSPSRSKRSSDPWRLSGWYVAAAAILIAFFAFFDLEQVPTSQGKRDALLASGAKLVQIDWQGLEEPYKGIQGDVVWSNERQEGYMLLKGLPKNDPTKEQYQLWIQDTELGKFNRIDGGVFDFTEDGVVIPIKAKIPVRKPEVFAITSEIPDGVVVSDGPLLAIAPVPQ